MIPDRLATAFQTAARGLAMQQQRINVASRNIANMNTSSAEGSSNGYQPQRVRSISPKPESFKQALSRSMGSLKTTDGQHFSGGSIGNGSFSSDRSLGPEFEIVGQDNYRYEYDPEHPDANAKGMVRYPDIDMVKEMTEMVSANRLYEANLSSIEAEKQIMRQSMDI